VDQSSPDFFHGTLEESLSIIFLSDFGYLESFRRYSRSKSKVVKNRAEFWTFFFALPNFRGPAFQKLYQCNDPCLVASWHVVWKMFCGDTPTSSGVMVANTLNFKPNFKFSRLKFVFFWGGEGPPSHFGSALSRLWQSLARV